MKASTSSPRVVVIGGGIFGASSALHLARLGARVTLVTEGSLASGASGRSLSWLNSARRRSAAYHQLRMTGIDRYRTMFARNPAAPWLRFDGGLTWDADDGDNAMEVTFAHERHIGYEAWRLMPEEIAAVTPGVDVRAVPPQGAIFNPGEGWVDLPSLIGVLIDNFRALGGVLVSDAGPTSAVLQGGRVGGAKAANGAIFDADAVLLATGPAVPATAAKLGYELPDATPTSLLVKTKPAGLPLRAVLNTPNVAVRPTPTGALVLDSAWSERETALGADGRYVVPDHIVPRLLTELSAVLEGNPRLELDSYGVGPKPVPSGGEPVFGRLGDIGGLFVAFSHSGATLGLIAGELLADEIVLGEPSPLLGGFRPDRFGPRSVPLARAS